MSTGEKVQAGRLQQRVNETYARRDESPAAWAAWEQASEEFLSYESPMKFIETVEGRKRLRAGEAKLVEYSISFLELDPFLFRSGYAKAAIIRCLKNLSFTQKQKERLRDVVLQVIDFRDRREMRDFCRLAAAVDGEDFEERIQERLTAEEPGIKRRARFVLAYVVEWRRNNKTSAGATSSGARQTAR